MARIFPSPSGGWLVELSAGGNPFHFPTKAQAIWFAVAWAEQHQPTEVRLYGNLGDLERIISLPNGHHRRVSGPDRRQAQVPIPFPDRRRKERRAAH